MEQSFKLRPIFVPSNVDAALANFFDGFAKVIGGVLILLGFGFPRDLIFGKMLPGLGFGVFLMHLGLWWLGNLQARRQKNPDITAFPAGIGAAQFFMWIFMILGPVYEQTKDPVLAISVGIAANIFSSILNIVFTLIGPWLLKRIPRPALMGSLAGGALSWLALSSMLDMFQEPVVAVVCFIIVMTLYISRIKTKIAPIMFSIIAGIILTVLTRSNEYFSGITTSFSDLSLNLPLPQLPMAFSGFGIMLKFVPILTAFALGGVVSNLQGVAQAHIYGDKYDVREISYVVSLTSIVSGLFGNPFQFTPWWGYNAWRERKTSTGYTLYVGVIYIVLGLTGLVSVITSVIPKAAALPVLLFVGISSAASAFAGSNKKYYNIVVIAMMIPIIEFVQSRMAADAVPLAAQILGAGAAITAIVWGSALYFLTEKSFGKSAVSMLVGAVMSLAGLMHNSKILVVALMDQEITSLSSLTGMTYGYMTLAYLLLAVVFLVLGKLKFQYDEEIEELAEVEA